MEEKKFIIPALVFGFLIRINPEPTILVVTQELNDILFGFVALIAYRHLQRTMWEFDETVSRWRWLGCSLGLTSTSACMFYNLTNFYLVAFANFPVWTFAGLKSAHTLALANALLFIGIGSMVWYFGKFFFSTYDKRCTVAFAWLATTLGLALVLVMLWADISAYIPLSVDVDNHYALLGGGLLMGFLIGFVFLVVCSFVIAYITTNSYFRNLFRIYSVCLILAFLLGFVIVSFF
jgi:hypothetical protein